MEEPMSEITENPPLASYYAAVAGRLFGWSERAMHIAFVFPALAVVLATYYLARRFTQFPLLAAAVVLFAPGFLVSSTTVMCDVLMLAFWMLAVVFWLEGTDTGNHLYLAVAALFVAASALSKYFGVSLIPLLFAYSLLKKHRLDPTVCHLAIPIALLALYQHWTSVLYGRGHLFYAIQYGSMHNRAHAFPLLVNVLTGLAFMGGCALPALLFVPLLWRRRWILGGLVLCILVGYVVSVHHAWFGTPPAAARWRLISVEMAILVGGGISVVGLVCAPLFRRNGDTAFLALWVAGTFAFASFVNWAVNARVILPMIPAVAILLVRQIDVNGGLSIRQFPIKVSIALLASAIAAVWVASADQNLADTGRTAANEIHARLSSSTGPIYFEGHWGFQYYMEKLGAKPADLRNSPFHVGDILVIPENTSNSFGPPPGFGLAGTIISFKQDASVATMCQPLGAGFYASVWGPLPFAVGPVSSERYLIARLVATTVP
jgi:4-amino-4-deoxy-L-arabinose transferase-like glycosyltransferase